MITEGAESKCTIFADERTVWAMIFVRENLLQTSRYLFPAVKMIMRSFSGESQMETKIYERLSATDSKPDSNEFQKKKREIKEDRKRETEKDSWSDTIHCSWHMCAETSLWERPRQVDLHPTRESRPCISPRSPWTALHPRALHLPERDFTTCLLWGIPTHISAHNK